MQKERSMEQIILCTDGSTYAETTYRYGAWFAQQLMASIEVLYVSEAYKKASRKTNLSGSLGFDASDALLKRIVSLEHDYARLEQDKSKEILKHARAYFETEGLLANTYAHHQGDLLADLQEQDSQADLIILGKCGSTGLNIEHHLGSNVERIMRSLHTPCLVTAQHYRPVDNVMLAYDGSPPCRSAFLQLLQLPFMQTIPLHLVQVAKHPDTETINHLTQLREQALNSGVETTVALLEGDIEGQLRDYIAQQDVTLLVMGIHGHRPIRNLIMGHTASHMIQETTIPVLLYR